MKVCGEKKEKKGSKEKYDYLIYNKKSEKRRSQKTKKN